MISDNKNELFSVYLCPPGGHDPHVRDSAGNEGHSRRGGGLDTVIFPV